LDRGIERADCFARTPTFLKIPKKAARRP